MHAIEQVMRRSRTPGHGAHRGLWIVAAVVLHGGLVWHGVLGLSADLQAREATVSFNSHIRAILAEHCLDCHGPDGAQRQADLRLDLEEAAKVNAIVPGSPDESELFRRITSSDPDERMPPPDTGRRLSGAQIEAVRQWIVEGARYERHWAFVPIEDPEPPQTTQVVRTEIDRFVIARLEERGLRLSPLIDRQQLIRRATFDLTGLPPTWDEVQAFVNDESPLAYEKVLDRLLDSPAYGERWARHWLDIARYADTHGGAAIGFTKFPFSYTYRDYVINAFNADLPYDRFVVEQLAADQLGLADDAPALAGLGFLTVGMQYRNPHDTIDDQIDVITRGLLGLTVACARCHDHKFDAIPTEDYYSLYAALASSQRPNRLPVIGDPPKSKVYQEYLDELAQLQISHDDLAREQSEIMRSRLRMQVGLYLREIAKGAPELDLSDPFLSYRTDDLRPLVFNRWRDYLNSMPDTDPVFGPWVRLARFDSEDFAHRCAQLVQALMTENGDGANEKDMHLLRTGAPRWNPLVLEALADQKPSTMLEVAVVYGQVFGEAHQRWLSVLAETSREATPGTSPIPDESPKHVHANSAIQRQLRRHLYAPGTPTHVEDELASKLLNRPISDNLSGRRTDIHNLHLTSPGSPPRAMTLKEDKSAERFFVFRRGRPVDRGEPVRARFLSTLSPPDSQPFRVGRRRLELAEAIVDPRNPLTRRVVVNWVWQHHFGRGLVRTPDDFGVRGNRPTHPKLLDYLATRFLEDGWSLKKLHRRIMLSTVYCQSSMEDAECRAADPDNDLLWRMPRRRLELEAMRDSMLSVSGELQTGMGGRPFMMLSKPVIPRRSVYAFVNRDIVSPFASTFDAANPNSCTAKRPETTVPQQTLFALNSDFIQDRAAALATHPDVVSAPTNVSRVRRLYQRTFSRAPRPDEVKLALEYIKSHVADSGKDPWQGLAHVLLAANEFVFVD